ncbi:MAG: permease [Desulfovibrionales bacterium]|nr:permease [Desulfovibrionales bacterium]
MLYAQLPALAQFLTDAIPGITKGSHLYEAVRFFLYDTPKILLLLGLVVFAVGVLRTWITPERSRRYLNGKESLGNVIAAGVGIITPFCSCSAVPLFLGFVAAGIPLGVTFSFLIAAPMVNEIALVLLYGLFGFKVAALYLITGVTIAVIAGWILGKMHLEPLLEPWVRQIRDDGQNHSPEYPSIAHRLDFAWDSVVDILGKTWLYIVFGIAIGAGIHGYVPEGAMASIMGKSAWWSVPAAVVIGVPMYASAAGIIPIVSALLGKGAALGTALAFMMSVVALSLPEMIILRKVLSVRLITIYVSIVAGGILLVGFLFNTII